MPLATLPRHKQSDVEQVTLYSFSSIRGVLAFALANDYVTKAKFLAFLTDLVFSSIHTIQYEMAWVEKGSTRNFYLAKVTKTGYFLNKLLAITQVKMPNLVPVSAEPKTMAKIGDVLQYAFKNRIEYNAFIDYLLTDIFANENIAVYGYEWRRGKLIAK